MLFFKVQAPSASAKPPAVRSGLILPSQEFCDIGRVGDIMPILEMRELRPREFSDFAAAGGQAGPGVRHSCPQAQLTLYPPKMPLSEAFRGLSGLPSPLCYTWGWGWGLERAPREEKSCPSLGREVGIPLPRLKSRCILPFYAWVNLRPGRGKG